VFSPDNKERKSTRLFQKIAKRSRPSQIVELQCHHPGKQSSSSYVSYVYAQLVKLIWLLNFSVVLRLETARCPSVDFPETMFVQSSQSDAISVRTLPMTCALAMSPCCSPSRIRTSHLRINLPSHRTLSTGTRESLDP